MSRSRPITLLAAAVAVPLAALVVAGCGGGGSGNGNGNSAAITPVKTSSGQTATVGVANNAKLGKVLVDAHGNTLYLFEKDKGGKSMCSGACATEWPPLMDGKSQVIYHGHPLYRYSGDTKPGDANGQGLNAFGAEWYAVAKSGNAVDTASSGSSGSSGGGYGY
jgi:predicted lipoprotein with Yx(FWY)xxD motif